MSDISTITNHYRSTEAFLRHLLAQAADQDLVADATEVKYKAERTRGYAAGLRNAVEQFREAKFDAHEDNGVQALDQSASSALVNHQIALEKLAHRIRVVESRVGRIEHTLREEEEADD
jgi:AcrR family transcriptional regulator